MISARRVLQACEVPGCGLGCGEKSCRALCSLLDVSGGSWLERRPDASSSCSSEFARTRFSPGPAPGRARREIARGARTRSAGKRNNTVMTNVLTNVRPSPKCFYRVVVVAATCRGPERKNGVLTDAQPCERHVL